MTENTLPTAEIPAEVTASLAEMKDAVGNLESAFAPLLALSPADVQERFSDLDKAKLRLLMAYGVNSLFYMFLKTQGERAADHPVMKELDRIKDYFGKLKDVTSKPQATKRGSKVDKEAASRFVKHGLGPSAELRKDDSEDSAERKERRKKEKKARREQREKDEKRGKKRKSADIIDLEEEEEGEVRASSPKKARKEKD